MPECKHETISRVLAEELAEHRYADRFPTVRELAARFLVSTRTMTKALKPLVKQGLIIPDGPRGCRVARRAAPHQHTGIVGIFAGIGKIVSEEDPLLAPLLACVRKDNCTPLLTNVPRTDMIRDPEFWRSSYLDGYIFVYSSFHFQLANLLKTEGIPFVAANRLPEHYGAHWADFDHYPVLCELARRLRGAGFRRIALLDKPSFSDSIAYSMKIWARIQDKLEIPPEERLGVFGAPEPNEGYALTLHRQFEALCAEHGAPDAVIARSNYPVGPLREILDEQSRATRIVPVSGEFRSGPPYALLAQAVWALFKRVRDGQAENSEYSEVPWLPSAAGR